MDEGAGRRRVAGVRRGKGVLVIKLGGALLRHPAALRGWLRQLRGARGVVVVPGGGSFADAVRCAQRTAGLSDAIAHVMALQAMAQFGWLLHGLHHRLRPASFAELAQLGRTGACVWIPDPSLVTVDDLAQDWSVTSDSLAAWLARRLRAASLIIIKSCPLVRPRRSAVAHARAGHLDVAFARHIAGAPFALFVLGAGEQPRLRRLLRRSAARRGQSI